jgi:hypothetical protein
MNAVIFAIATASSAFNLICTGMDDRQDKAPALGGHQPVPSTNAPFREVYRVDLHQRRWCAGECRTTRGLYSVTPDTITFEFERTPPYSHAFVSRETGKYVRQAYFGTVESFRWGSCKRAPFTGFPMRRF